MAVHYSMASFSISQRLTVMSLCWIKLILHRIPTGKINSHSINRLVLSLSTSKTIHSPCLESSSTSDYSCRAQNLLKSLEEKGLTTMTSSSTPALTIRLRRNHQRLRVKTTWYKWLILSSSLHNTANLCNDSTALHSLDSVLASMALNLSKHQRCSNSLTSILKLVQWKSELTTTWPSLKVQSSSLDSSEIVSILSWPLVEELHTSFRSSSKHRVRKTSLNLSLHHDDSYLLDSSLNIRLQTLDQSQSPHSTNRDLRAMDAQSNTGSRYSRMVLKKHWLQLGTNSSYSTMRLDLWPSMSQTTLFS